MVGIYIIGGLFTVIGMVVSARLKSKFKKYSKVPTSAGLTGKQVAEKMLRDSGINDVQVISVRGTLTDHYNPINRTVNLSEPVYNLDSVATAAVAAHECGHAVQHAKGYSFLHMRSKLVPAISFASRYMQWILLAGIAVLSMFQRPEVLLVGIILFSLTTLFSFITLPVEFDASRRALEWLDEARITSRAEHTMAQNALKWAAMTYVVAALSSLATLLYYISILLRNRR